MVKLLSHILCYLLLLSCCTRHQLWESRKSLFYCSVLCPCFLSLFLLLFKSRTTSSSTSSAYSNIHKAPAAYHAVPSGICALHKYLFASIAVLYRQKPGREEELARPPPFHPSVCVLLFFAVLRQAVQRHCGPPLGWAPPILLLMCRFHLTMHHSVLYLSSSITGCSLYCHCACYVLGFFLCILSPFMFSSLPPTATASSCFLSVCLCMCRLIGWPSFSPVLYLEYSVSLPLHLPHEDSAPAEVDELSQPQWAGEEWEKFAGGPRGEAEEGRSQRHLEQVHKIWQR